MRIAFVDESKSNKYILGVAVVDARDLKFVRLQLRSFRKQGQNRVHFAKENDSRRREMLSVVRRLPVNVFVLVSYLKHEADARDQCLRKLISVVGEVGISRLVLEEDHSLIGRDRAVIAEAVRKSGLSNLLDYIHESPNYEPCLWIPDAIAWSEQRGGNWKTLAGLR